MAHKDRSRSANLFLNGSAFAYGAMIDPLLFTVAADGALRHCLSHSLIPSVVIGDFDSLRFDPEQIMREDNPGFDLALENSEGLLNAAGKLPKYPQFLMDKDQETTDFDKAAAYLWRHGFQQIFVYHFGGDRFDHMLAGLSTVLQFQELDFVLFSGNQRIDVVKPGRDYLFPATIGQTISLIPFWDAGGIDSDGLRWPLRHGALRFGDMVGVSNQALAEKVKIRFQSGNLLVIRNWQQSL